MPRKLPRRTSLAFAVAALAPAVLIAGTTHAESNIYYAAPDGDDASSGAKKLPPWVHPLQWAINAP